MKHKSIRYRIRRNTVWQLPTRTVFSLPDYNALPWYTAHALEGSRSENIRKTPTELHAQRLCPHARSTPS